MVACHFVAAAGGTSRAIGAGLSMVEAGVDVELEGGWAEEMHRHCHNRSMRRRFHPHRRSSQICRRPRQGQKLRK